MAAVFSDLDGTLVHYVGDVGGRVEALDGGLGLRWSPSEGGPAVAPVAALPASSSGLVGYVSSRTLALCAAARAAGHPLVLVTGARAATALSRLPFLPECDALYVENGGRAFVAPGRRPAGAAAAPPAAAPLVEDLAWRATHADAAGPLDHDARPPEERGGTLWAWYRELAADGWKPDAAGYTTDFRVKASAKNGKSAEDLAAVIGRAPPGLACSFNLGSADFYPKTSGKANAVRHACALLGVDAARAVCVCDDDNDIDMAHAVGHAYVPGFTSESMRKAVADEPHRFTVAEARGFLGTHEALERLLADFGSAA